MSFQANRSVSIMSNLHFYNALKLFDTRLLLLVLIIIFLNLAAISIRNRLRENFKASEN